MLQCKAESALKTDAVEPKIKAKGLSQGADGFILTLKKGQRPSLFGDDLMAVLVTAADSEKKIAVYLKNRPRKNPIN